MVPTLHAQAAGPASTVGVAWARALFVLCERVPTRIQPIVSQGSVGRVWAARAARSLSPELAAAETQQGPKKQSRYVDDATFFFFSIWVCMRPDAERKRRAGQVNQRVGRQSGDGFRKHVLSVVM